VVFDSDVLVWHQRECEKATRAINEAETRAISIVSYMELMRGARDRQEMQRVISMVLDFGFEMLPLSESIGHRASIYIQEYVLSSGLEVADALIAATAVEHGLTLCTANPKHYRPIRDLEVKAFRP